MSKATPFAMVQPGIYRVQTVAEIHILRRNKSQAQKGCRSIERFDQEIQKSANFRGEVLT